MRRKKIGTLRTTREAASRLRLSRKTLANLRVGGGGPDFLKLGGRVFYEAEELELFLEVRRMSTTRTRSRG